MPINFAFIIIFCFFHFWAPQGLFWPLKGLYLKSRAKLAFGVVQKLHIDHITLITDF